MLDTRCLLQIRSLTSDFDVDDKLLLVMWGLIFRAWSFHVLNEFMIQNAVTPPQEENKDCFFRITLSFKTGEQCEGIMLKYSLLSTIPTESYIFT